MVRATSTRASHIAAGYWGRPAAAGPRGRSHLGSRQRHRRTATTLQQPVSHEEPEALPPTTPNYSAPKDSSRTYEATHARSICTSRPVIWCSLDLAPRSRVCNVHTSLAHLSKVHRDADRITCGSRLTHGAAIYHLSPTVSLRRPRHAIAPSSFIRPPPLSCLGVVQTSSFIM